jgi:hypothetical protein
MPPFPVNILKRRTMVVIKSAALLFGDITKPCLTYINVCNTIYIIRLMHARTHARAHTHTHTRNVYIQRGDVSHDD